MKPASSLDAAPYWEGLRAGSLLVQRCGNCHTYRHYPRSMCPACHSFDLDWVPVSGEGKIHSWTTVHSSVLPGFAESVPYTVVTVDLAEKVRMLGLWRKDESVDLKVGMPVRASVEPGPTGVPHPVFRPA